MVLDGSVPEHAKCRRPSTERSSTQQEVLEMSEMVIGGRSAESGSACSPAARVTRSLLGYGILAGPFYVVVALAQGLLRPGFDLARDDVSLLSNGDWGWI